MYLGITLNPHKGLIEILYLVINNHAIGNWKNKILRQVADNTVKGIADHFQRVAWDFAITLTGKTMET